MSDFKTINPLWHLADPLTVQQAAALIANFDPNCISFDCEGKPAHFEGGFDAKRLPGNDSIVRVQAAFAALVNAINAENLKATIRRNGRLQGWDEFPNIGESIRPLCEGDGRIKEGYEPAVIYCEAPDWTKTTVALGDLRAWLTSQGVKTGFLFPTATDATDYLDPKNPRYAPKLAAAVRAWQAVTDPKGKHPKQALTKWLREHAAEFGLTDDEGKPNETGIEEVAKVANWQPGGGAPKTPGG